MTRQVIETGNSFVLVPSGVSVPGRTSTPTVVRRTNTSLTLSVTRGGGGIATLYRWRYSTNSTVSDSDPKVTSSGPSVTISNLSPGTSYWIDVRAENSAGNSSYSGNLATSTTGTAPIDPPTTSTTVSANAGSNVSVRSGGSVSIGGSDTVTNGRGSTTIAWTKRSGTGSSLSSTSAASPTFNAPTVSSQRTIIWRKTVTNNGVSDTDDVTVTVTTSTTTPTITTDTDSIWCYETSNASSPPSGGLTTRVHTPTGCSRSSLSADTTRWVYKYTRTRTYTNGSFTSATAWGNGTRVHSPTGSAPLSLPRVSDYSGNPGGGITLPAATGGTGNYTYSASGFTSRDATFNSSTRRLGFKINARDGTYRITYSVSDGVNSVSRRFDFTIGDDNGGDGNGGGGRGTRAPGDGTYRLTVGVEIASALRADPNSPAYLSYIEIDGANEKLNIFIGSTSTDRSAGTDLSSQWETAGRLGIRHTTPSGVSTEWFDAPFDTDNAAPYTNLKQALIALATEDQSEPRTIILDDNALPNARAPTVTINAVADGDEGTTVRLRATVSGGLYDQIFYVWTVGGGDLNTRFPTAPAWTRPAVTADGTTDINLEIHVAGNGTRAASGTSGVVVATTLAATVRNVPVITTDVDKIFRLAAMQPAPPTGGTSTQTHTPTDWTRSEPKPTATQTVWRSERTRSYGDGSFTSASVWGTPARIYHDIWLAGYTPNRIYRSINNGASWGSAINGPSGQTFINGIAIAPNGDLWLAGQSPDKIYRSTDNGANWKTGINGPSGQTLISGIAVARNGDLWLSGSTPDDIYKSTDNGATWSSAGISGPSGQRAIAGIAVAPNGDIWLAGSVPDDVYRSTDNGQTWGSGIDGPSLQTRLSGISVAPNGDIWLCGSSGNDIYRSTDNGANWSAEINGPSGQTRISGIAVDPHTPPVITTLSASASTGVPIARAALVAVMLSASAMAGAPTAQVNLASSSISIKASAGAPSASANLLPGPLAISASSGINSASVDIISQLPFDLSWAAERGRTVYVSAVVTAGVPRGNGTVYEDQPGRTPLGSVSADSDMESQTGQSVTAIALNELFTGNITFWDAPSPLAWSTFFTDNPDVSLWMQFAPTGPVYPFVARGHGGTYSAWATGDTAAQAAVTTARAEGARFAFVLRGAPAAITFFASSTAGVPTGAANLQQPTLSTIISAGVPTARVNLQGQLLSATASAGVPTATIDIEEQGVGINAYVPPYGYRPIVLAFLEADVSGADITAEPTVTVGTGNDLIVASDLVISQVERHVAGSQIRLRRSGDGEFSTYFDNEGSPLYPDARLQILYDGSLIDGSIANTGGGFNNWSVANSAQRSRLNAIATGERFVLAILKKITIEASVGAIAPAARVALALPLITVDASAGVPTARVYFDSLPLSASSTAGTPTVRADLAAAIISISASVGTPTARAALIPPTISLTATTNTPTAKASLVPPTLSASTSAGVPTARAYLASLLLTTNDIDLTNLDVYALALINTGTPTGATGTIYNVATNIGSIDAGGDLTARPGQDITRIGLNPQGSGTLRFWDTPAQASWTNFFGTYPRATLRLQFEIPGPAYELTRGGQGGNFSNWSTSNTAARVGIASARADGKKFIFLLAEERIAVRAGEGERGSVATAGVEGVGRKIDAATRSGSGEFGESATEGVEGAGSSRTVTGMGEGEVGRVTASGVEGQGASIVIKRAGSGEFGKIITSGKEGIGKKIVLLPSTGSGEFGRISTAGIEGTGAKIDLLPVVGSGEFGGVIIAGVEGAGVKIIPLPAAGSGEFGSIVTSGKEGVGRRIAASTRSGTGEFGTVSFGGTEGEGRRGGDLTGFTKIGEVRGISFPRTGLEGDASYEITLRSRDRTGNTGNLVPAGTVLTEDLLDVPGAEFVFQQNNTGIVPNPPLSTEKQRKTDNYIPTGWSDNPQGVNVSNRYEYISSRTGSTGRWSEFGPPGLYDIFLVEGETEAQFIFRRTTSASAPNTPSSNAAQRTTNSYIPSSWVRSARGTTEALPYEWASYRLGSSGNWSVFYPPTLREAHPTARGPIPFFRAISGSSWSNSEANSATTGNNVTGDRVTLYNTSAKYTKTRVWNGSAWITIGKWIDGNLIVEGSILSIFDIIAGAAVQSSNYRAGMDGWRIAQDGDAEFNGLIVSEQILSNVRNWDFLIAGSNSVARSTPVSRVWTGKGTYTDYDAFAYAVSFSQSGAVFSYLVIVYTRKGTGRKHVSINSTSVNAQFNTYIQHTSARTASLGWEGGAGNITIGDLWGLKGSTGSSPPPPPPPPPPPITTTTTVAANAGPNVSVESGGSTQIGGVDAITNPSGSTTYRWVRRSGTGGSLSSATIAQPTFTAPTVSSNRNIAWRKTTTNNGVSDTDDVIITVTPAATTAPNTPSTPSATTRGQTSLTLSTTPGSGGAATLYRWRYSLNRTVSNADTVVTSAGPSITIPGLTADTNYWIDVRAENSTGNSAHSGVLATSTSSSATSPTNPLSLPSISNKSNTAQITYPLPAATGGTGNYTYSTSTLPRGFSFSLSTRTLTASRGTSDGDYTIIYSVSDGVNSVSRTFNVNIYTESDNGNGEGNGGSRGTR